MGLGLVQLRHLCAKQTQSFVEKRIVSTVFDTTDPAANRGGSLARHTRDLAQRLTGGGMGKVLAGGFRKPISKMQHSAAVIRQNTAGSGNGRSHNTPLLVTRQRRKDLGGLITEWLNSVDNREFVSKS